MNQVVNYQSKTNIADSESARSLILLCNPYEQDCLFNGSHYDDTTVLLLQWLASAYMLYNTSNIYYNDVMTNSGLYRDDNFPFLHATSTWGWHVVVWTVEAALVIFTNFFVTFIGLGSDIFQAPRIMRKWFAVAVNLNAYSFIFVNWVLLVFVGYWLFLQEETSLSDAIAKAYYRTFIDSIVTGAIGLRLLSSVRYWYWDGVIAYEASIDTEAKAIAAEQAAADAATQKAEDSNNTQQESENSNS